MTDVRITLRGESWIRLDVVADCYACEVSLVESVVRLGMLGPTEREGPALFVRTATLDRVATILRLHLHHELDLTSVSALLDDDD
jgi:hypothetical protein